MTVIDCHPQAKNLDFISVSEVLMLEKEIERKLKKAVINDGGLALKFISPSLNGVPDRLLLFHDGKAAFCETKAPGKRLRPLQVKRKRQLEALGFKVYVIDSIEQIGDMIDDIHTT